MEFDRLSLWVVVFCGHRGGDKGWGGGETCILCVK